MAVDRVTLRTTAAIQRRPAVATRAQRGGAETPRPPARALQERLGNRATQTLARSIAPEAPAPVQVIAPVSVQYAKARRLPAKVSHPRDPGELEAEATARKVMRMREPPAAAPPNARETTKGSVQRDEARSPAAARAASSPRVQIPGGAPLPASVRAPMEARFGASFGHVRVHTGEAAAQKAASVGAQAFTVGEHIFFAKDKFQPQSAAGRELIAHELTHTIQQQASVQRSVEPNVTQRSEPRIQRWGLDDVLDWIADKANYIPGFRMLTIVLGVNPINWKTVDRSGANILRALLELIPVIGPMVAEALENYGILEKAGKWMDGKIHELGMVGSALKDALDEFLDSLGWTDIFDPGDVWDRGKRIFTDPIDRLISFGKSVISDILGFIRDAILLPLAKLAEGERGYDLLKAILGKDPITEEEVDSTPEAVIGGFMKFIGEEEVWENIKKANAIPRAWAWFQGALKDLLTLVAGIPTMFLDTLKSLEIIDLILPPKAFIKIVGVFGRIAGQFVSWAFGTILDLLEIVFDVVSPGASEYIKQTGAAFTKILKDPLPFVRNLARAAKLGFQNFKANFFEHLQAGLLDWLTGSLPGIYIPKEISLPEIAKFVFSALQISWAHIRAKLVKATSEETVKTLEESFDVVVTLVREGPAAAWDKIMGLVGDLKKMVIGGIINLVVDAVTKKAIPKLLAMFIPGAGFIAAILSIYDMIMVFVRKLTKIGEVIGAFVTSLAAIAAGKIDVAAKRVEDTLAGILALAINFLAGFGGLGNISASVMGVINRIRAPIDKALDWLVGWIVKAAKTGVAKGKAAVKKALAWAFATKTFKDSEGKQHTLYVNDKGVLTVESAPQAAAKFVDWYVKDRSADKKKLGDKIKKVVEKAQDVVDDIEKITKKGNEVPAATQQKLLKLNTEISSLLAELLAGERNIGKTKEKYLLEGQVGTYETIPKPVGDKLTPDHQPQASVILAAADFFAKNLNIQDGELAERAKTRAAKGYAINLHFRRHVAGATYGSKGETRQGYYEKLVAKAGNKEKAEAKKLVVEALQETVKKDVLHMKKVAKQNLADEPWKQLTEEAETATDAAAIKKQVAERIEQGEDQIAAQPFNF